MLAVEVPLKMENEKTLSDSKNVSMDTLKTSVSKS